MFDFEPADGEIWMMSRPTTTLLEDFVSFCVIPLRPGFYGFFVPRST